MNTLAEGEKKRFALKRKTHFFYTVMTNDLVMERNALKVLVKLLPYTAFCYLVIADIVIYLVVVVKEYSGVIASI